MILKKEIERLAEEKGVPKSTIDKDWVLGHVVDGIYTVTDTRDTLIFKGGTCLKKCYFPNYRFSEDLDFTATEPDFHLTKRLLNEVISVVTERVGIPLHLQENKPLYHQDRLTGYNAKIKFWGADHPRNQQPPPPPRWHSSIKIEVILFEQMEFEVARKAISHRYSDDLSDTAHNIPCYAIEEILAEKLRSLIQRSYPAPRDFYDIWYLSRSYDSLNWTEIVRAFSNKVAFKELTFSGVHQMVNEQTIQRLRGAWSQSLIHQISSNQLPEFELVKQEVVDLLNQLFADWKL